MEQIRKYETIFEAWSELRSFPHVLLEIRKKEKMPPKFTPKSKVVCSG